jgi:predicted MFS family arabinose efflux permease
MTTQSHDASPGVPPTWPALAPLCLTAVAAVVQVGALAPLAPAIARDLGTSVALVGQVGTASLATTAAAHLLVGPLADHFGRRRAILLALGALAAGAAGVGLAPAYAALVAAGLVAGLGGTVLGLVAAVAAARHPGAARGRALGRIQGTQTLGVILGAPLLTAIAAAAGWRGGYAVVVVACALAFALVARALPRDPCPAGRFTGRAALAAYRPLLGDRRMLALYTACALRAAGWLGPWTYLGALYAERHGLSLRQVGLAFMVASGGICAGNLAAGQWLGRVAPRRAFSAATATLAVTWVAVYAAPLGAAPTVALVTIASCAAGIGLTSLTTLVAAETPAPPATTMSLNSAAFAAGSALGMAAGGALIGLGGYTLLGLALPLCPLAAALLVWQPRVAPRRPTRRAWHRRAA